MSSNSSHIPVYKKRMYSINQKKKQFIKSINDFITNFTVTNKKILNLILEDKISLNNLQHYTTEVNEFTQYLLQIQKI